ncbi:hypothetical protein AKJ16_DCAP24663 [Drosera capensis]
MKYAKSGDQIEDIFIKDLKGTKFEEFRSSLGMVARSLMGDNDVLIDATYAVERSSAKGHVSSGILDQRLLSCEGYPVSITKL